MTRTGIVAINKPGRKYYQARTFLSRRRGSPTLRREAVQVENLRYAGLF